jgi:hypothetical protein
MRIGSRTKRAIISNKAIGKAYAGRHETKLHPMATEQGEGGARLTNYSQRKGQPNPIGSQE